MTADDAQPMLAACMNAGMRKTAPLFERYLNEQDAGSRVVLVAFAGEKFAGYLTVMWESDYPPFRDEDKPYRPGFSPPRPTGAPRWRFCAQPT